MNKIIVAIFSALSILSSPAKVNAESCAIIKNIENNGRVIIEFSKNNTVYNTLNIPDSNINAQIYEGMEIPVISIEGKFHCDIVGIDRNGIEHTYYQFRSDDDAVWWDLTLEEIGFIPNMNDKYILYYTDNGTTKETPVCDCLPEWDCECYLYDDIFFYIERGN